MDVGGLTTFFVLTFALTWAIFFSVDPMGGLNPLFLVGVFVPSLVAMTLTWRAQGTAGVRALLDHITRWDVGGRWYVFAILYMAAIKMAAAAIVRVTTGAWPAFGDNLLLIPFGIAISTPVQAGEEIGWRGYALPRLTAMFGLRWASVTVGAIWALWHLPLFYVVGTDTTGQSFPVYMAQVIALSVAISWLYSHTACSLLLVMLMHSAINQVTGLVAAAGAPSAHPWTFTASQLSWLTLALLWLCATYFLWRMPRRLPCRSQLASAPALRPPPAAQTL